MTLLDNEALAGKVGGITILYFGFPLKRLTFLLLLFSMTARAKLRPLLEEFLVSRLQLKINQLEKSQVLIDRKLLAEGKRWSFVASSHYQDSQLVSHSSSGPLASNLVRTSYYALGISKDFPWGARLSFDNALSQVNRSNLVESSLFQQSLIFSQDLGKNFFGQKFYTSLQEADEGVYLSQVVLSQKNQKELNAFYQNYLSVRLKKTLFVLQKKALHRSQERLKMTRKRVRDGLNGKADLYSAQIEHVRRQEELTEAHFYWKEALNNLSQYFHRQMRSEEINRVSLKTETLTKVVDDDIWKNSEVKKLESQLRKSNLELQNLKRDYLPRVTLSGTYRTNNGDEKVFRAVSNGHWGGDHHEYMIALNLNMPLSFARERLNESHKRVQITSLEMLKKQTLEQLERYQETLQEEMSTRLKNLTSSHHRIELSQKNLKENNRLYHIGRSDFDRLMRAEESLINTERSYVNHWFLYEVAVAKKASLYGKLLETIRGKPL